VKNPRENDPPLFNPAAARLKHRFAEKKREFWVFSRREVAMLAGRQAIGPLCTLGFRGKIPLGLPSPKSC